MLYENLAYTELFLSIKHQTNSKILMKRLLLLFLVLLSCSRTNEDVREKAIFYKNAYNWYGPATQAIDGFCWTYYRTPISTKELIEYIDMICEEIGDYAFFGDAEYLKEDLLNNPNHFVSYADSCFFYSQEYNGIREGVCAYSPKYQLETLGKLNSTERFQLENFFTTRLYGNDGKYYTCDYHIKQDLDNRLKETRNGFTYMLGRIDVDQSWPYRTLFSYKRDGDLCFTRLNIPDDQVRIYDIKNSVLLEEVFQDYSLLDEMMNKLKVVLQDFMDKNPKVDSIVFYSPLCF